MKKHKIAVSPDENTDYRLPCVGRAKLYALSDFLTRRTITAYKHAHHLILPKDHEDRILLMLIYINRELLLNVHAKGHFKCPIFKCLEPER